MARPVKTGLDYFPFDVGFFSDLKAKILKSRYGNDGLIVYLYLICEIYKNGYYLKTNDDFIYIVSDDLNMNTDKIGQIMNFLLERSLFSDKLFKSDKVLTSRGIQKRFQEAIKTRALKNAFQVNEFWVLSDEETQSYIKVTHNGNCSEKNLDYSEKNPNCSEKNDTKESKVKESKVKKSKGKEMKEQIPTPPKSKFGTYQNVLLTAEELEKLKNKFSDYSERIEELSFAVESKGYKYQNHCATIESWARREGKEQSMQKATQKKGRISSPPTYDIEQIDKDSFLETMNFGSEVET